MIRDVRPLSSRSISKSILLLETNAISVPEKKAENINTMIISMNNVLDISSIVCFCSVLFCVYSKVACLIGCKALGCVCLAFAGACVFAGLADGCCCDGFCSCVALGVLDTCGRGFGAGCCVGVSSSTMAESEGCGASSASDMGKSPLELATE